MPGGQNCIACKQVRSCVQAQSICRWHTLNFVKPCGVPVGSRMFCIYIEAEDASRIVDADISDTKFKAWPQVQLCPSVIAPKCRSCCRSVGVAHRKEQKGGKLETERERNRSGRLPVALTQNKPCPVQKIIGRTSSWSDIFGDDGRKLVA